MRIIVFLVLGLSIPWQNSVAGRDTWRNHTDVLPQYCKNEALGGQRWRKQCRKTFGGACGPLPHYCKGVYAEYVARSSGRKQVRDHALGTVIGQMRYTSGGCRPGCVLYPELHTRWGWALQEKTGDSAEAIKHYRLAIQAKPTYTLAYGRLADLYVDLELPEEAKKVLKEGLKARPGSRGLQRRLGKLETSQ